MHIVEINGRIWVVNFSKINIDGSYSSGERSNIRRIRVDDPEELERLRIIENDPETQKYIENLQTTDEGLIEFAKGTEKKLCVGIVGKDGFAKPAEVDKLQGWVYFYPEDEERFLRLRAKKTLSNSFKSDEIFEISYAKLPGALPGQMSSGLRQAVKVLRREGAKEKVQMILIAYTDKVNINSERLLQAVGFRRTGELEYHEGSGKLDEVWILKLI